MRIAQKALPKWREDNRDNQLPGPLTAASAGLTKAGKPLNFHAMRGGTPKWGTMGGGVVFLGLVLFAAFYFLPALIAGVRSKRDVVAIFALNLLLGWTVVGWVAALVWALTSDPPDTIYVVHK